MVFEVDINMQRVKKNYKNVSIVLFHKGVLPINDVLFDFNYTKTYEIVLETDRYV